MGSGRQLGPQNRFRLEGAGIEGELRLHRDFTPLTFSSAAEVVAPVVFAGYGVTATEHGYDDYEGLDARGAVVLVLRRVPREGAPGGPFGSDSAHATFAAKVANAEAHGASAFVFVNNVEGDGGEAPGTPRAASIRAKHRFCLSFPSSRGSRREGRQGLCPPPPAVLARVFRRNCVAIRPNPGHPDVVIRFG